jgi:hypothetical protein
MLAGPVEFSMVDETREARRFGIYAGRLGRILHHHHGHILNHRCKQQSANNILIQKTIPFLEKKGLSLQNH